MAELVIIGCPRSGTSFTAWMLRKMGLRIGHEVAGKHGIVSWELGSPFVSHPEGAIVLHQVRDPVENISSMRIVGQENWDKIRRHSSGVIAGDETERSMRMWLYWNRWCEAQAAFTYRIESVDEFCESAPLLLSWKRQARKNKRLGQKKRRGIKGRLSAGDLETCNKGLWKMIENQARKYGYSY